jgi:mono/diheme cytochrome c family protein
MTKPETTTTRPDTAPKVATKPAPRRPPKAPTATARPRKDATSTRDTAQPTPAAPARPDTAASQPAETTAATPAPSTQATAPLQDPYHRAPLDTVPQQVYDGWKQYNLNCARCHGEDVLGTTIAPHLIVSLKPDGPINTKELFVQTVCAGRPAKGMPAWCALGMEMPTIEAIYSYVKGRSDAKLHPGRPALKEGG